MEARSSHAGVNPLSPAVKQTSWRYFVLRDGLTFLSLTAVALLLGGITTLLFRSFQAHRETLADEWVRRGQQQLQQGQAEQAAASLRTALTYRPDDQDTEMQLAEALAASGHLNEAENYFLTLWEAAPGDGPINLQLARLARTRGDGPTAINYYRAAVFGTWQGDAPLHRRDTRLELSQYQIERGDRQAARAELLIAASNNTDAATQLHIGGLLEQAHDPSNAMTAYSNAMASDPARPVAQAKAGELCFAMGNYHCAETWLAAALRSNHWTPEQTARMTQMRDDASRLQQLAFDPQLSTPVRVERLANAAHRAQTTLNACVLQGTAPGGGLLPALQQRWKTLDTAKNRSQLRRDDDMQQQFSSLIYDTVTAVQSCSAFEKDDRLLLYLRSHPVTRFGAAG